VASLTPSSRFGEELEIKDNGEVYAAEGEQLDGVVVFKYRNLG
jgi:hypothetical protein